MKMIAKIAKIEIAASVSVLIVGLVLLVATPFMTSCSTKKFVMPTNGMKPTIVAGDSVTADMTAYESSEPQLGDLAIFIPSAHPEKRWVFRIAGIPGDALVYENGVLRRNGKKIVSPAFSGSKTFGPVESTETPFKENQLVLSQDEYFFLSDDPEHYNDSRAWGVVSRANILGKVLSHE